MIVTCVHIIESQSPLIFFMGSLGPHYWKGEGGFIPILAVNFNQVVSIELRIACSLKLTFFKAFIPKWTTDLPLSLIPFPRTLFDDGHFLYHIPFPSI